MARTRTSRELLSAAVHYLSAASLLTTAALESAGAGALGAGGSGETLQEFLVRLGAEKDSTARSRLVRAFVDDRAAAGAPEIRDSTVTFLYCGEARRVTVPGDLNGWNPAADSMTRVPGTRLFTLTRPAPGAARFEYKFAVDSVWILDPFNRRQAMGGYGPNSEVWMPAYRPPAEIVPRLGIPHGKTDTLIVPSQILGRSHPVFVYSPPVSGRRTAPFPVLVVTDGGEYLTLALMNTILDNLLADGAIEPIVAVFVDPRTDPRDPSTSMRMQDYAMSDSFSAFLIGEVLPHIRERYRVSDDPARTGILGASLGGLCAAYTALTHPEVFGICAAQSPAFWWNERAVIARVDSMPKVPVRFWIDTGTIRDAEEGARAMRAALERKGYDLLYTEVPESHNWVNWRARLGAILTAFWRRSP